MEESYLGVKGFVETWKVKEKMEMTPGFSESIRKPFYNQIRFIHHLPLFVVSATERFLLGL